MGLTKYRPTLHLICGLPGSGKSTLAKKLAIELPALLLTPDEWMGQIIGDFYDEEKRSRVEALQWGIAAQALRLGIDVIRENGFWDRSERDVFRSRAESVGAKTKLHYLDVPLDELLRRLSARNATSGPDVPYVNEADLRRWHSKFEAPTADELDPE